MARTILARKTRRNDAVHRELSAVGRLHRAANSHTLTLPIWIEVGAPWFLVMCDLLACLRIAKVFITTRLHPAHFQGLFIAGIATLIALLTAFDSLPGSVGYADGATFIAMSLLIGCAPPSYHEICSQNSQAVYDNEADRVRAQNSRARRYGLPATLMVVQWLAKVRFYHYLCAYCQQRPYQVLHHLLPLGISSSTREPGGTTIEFSRVGFFRQTLLPRYAWVL